MAQFNVKLPDIGEGVTEGELVQWLVKVGDAVVADQPVAEVMTDKATVEVPTPVGGVVAKLLAKEGDTIPIETVILELNSEGASAPARTTAAAAAPPPSSPIQPKAVATEHRTPVAEASVPTSAAPAAATAQANYLPPAEFHVLAAPATRRLAREMAIDINQVAGTGPAGRVMRDDVLNYGTNGAGAVAAGQPQISVRGFDRSEATERVPLRGIRRKIAETMQNTKRIVPHFTLMDEARVDQLVNLRTEAKSYAEKHGVKVTYLPFIVKALVASIREFPKFNASIDDAAQEIIYKKYFHIGFAADTDNGLLVPVIKNADQKTLMEIAAEITSLSEKARMGKLSLDEMKGACISITNIGSVGGTYATPIINHPEVAILGVYKIQDKPVWSDGGWARSQVMNFTITCDHRLIDGAEAARFLKRFIERIEHPSHMMLEMI